MVEPVKRILVVDDEEEFVNTVQRHLKREGYSLEVASDGNDARQKIQDSFHNEAPFDLVITDVVMPNSNGLQLLQWIKKTHPELSAILISGYGSFNFMLMEETIREEMDECGDKPITPQALMELISSVNRKRAQL
jgi:DNA-binding NtrC family response regulator